MEIAGTRQPHADDDVLIAGLKQGRAGAYEQLMRRYNRLLFRAARGIVHDDAEAQDAVQEAYLRAFLGLQSFRGESTLATWLTRIVINQALSQQRKLGRLVLWNEDADGEEGAMPPVNPPVDESGPEDELARSQVRQRLHDAIDLLPPIYRIVFMLRAVQGMSVEDTALSLSVSQDVVKTRFLRARGMLRTHLQAEPESGLHLVHDFQGQRCDDTVNAVLARLRALGVVRDH
jgi:RNA polymerase sigma-70 factor, ECF subfamily